MKKIVLVILLLCTAGSFSDAGANPWFRRTGHKLIKKMSRRQVHEAQLGRPLYERHNGKVQKNTYTQWGSANKPYYYNQFSVNKKDTRKPIFRRK
jgi:hypothetical protein